MNIKNQRGGAEYYARVMPGLVSSNLPFADYYKSSFRLTDMGMDLYDDDRGKYVRVRGQFSISLDVTDGRFLVTNTLAPRGRNRIKYDSFSPLGWWNGRHVCLRGICREAWGFESPPEHHIDLRPVFAGRLQRERAFLLGTASPLVLIARAIRRRRG